MHSQLRHVSKSKSSRRWKKCPNHRKYILKRDELLLASVSFIMAGRLIHPFRAVESFLPASQPTITFGDFIYDHKKPREHSDLEKLTWKNKTKILLTMIKLNIYKIRYWPFEIDIGKICFNPFIEIHVELSRPVEVYCVLRITSAIILHTGYCFSFFIYLWLVCFPC